MFVRVIRVIITAVGFCKVRCLCRAAIEADHELLVTGQNAVLGERAFIDTRDPVAKVRVCGL